MSEFEVFERYRAIVDDWPAFEQSLRRELPLCIWTNTLRATPAELHRTMVAEGFELEPLSWHAAGFRLCDTEKPGIRWQFLAGLYHVQEEVSMLPVRLLDPQPGERVLDLCAAPGNKSAQAAVAMRNTGTLIANDISFNLLRALRQTCYSVLDRRAISSSSRQHNGMPTTNGGQS